MLFLCKVPPKTRQQQKKGQDQDKVNVGKSKHFQYLFVNMEFQNRCEILNVI